LFKALSIGLQSQLQSIAIRLGVSSAMALREFERFLELKQFMKDSKPEKLSPTPLMDAVWHAALLETELYDRIEEHIGIRLHHSTAGAATDAVASAERGRRLAVLHQLYHLRYNEHPVEPPAALAFPRAPGHVRLFVKTLGGETTTLDVQPTDTVASVKQCMYITEGIPTAQQNLSFAGKHVRRNRTPLAATAARAIERADSIIPPHTSVPAGLPSCSLEFQLEDGRTPASYKITDEATVHLVLDLRGC
jgi:hypothetical protein